MPRQFNTSTAVSPVLFIHNRILDSPSIKKEQNRLPAVISYQRQFCIHDEVNSMGLHSKIMQIGMLFWWGSK